MKEITSEIVVIGGGPAGYMAALRAKQLGADVLIIEENELGGTCLHAGCIPTKALLATANILAEAHVAPEHGIKFDLTKLSWPDAVSRKDRVVRSLAQGLEETLRNRGVRIVKSRGYVVAPDEVMVTGKDKAETRIRCHKLILATGNKPRKLDLPGMDLPGVIYSSDILSLQHLPSSLAIIGAGAIGLEMATIFSAAGVKVTIIEENDRLFPGEEEAVSRELLKSMKRQGITFRLGAKVLGCEQGDERLILHYQQEGRAKSANSERVLVAAGTKLSTDAFAALPLHIVDEAILVNDRMETNLPGVYAAGDVVGGEMLAHVAYAEGRVAGENAAGCCNRMDYKAIPVCIYTNPEYARVGLSEAEAILQSIQVKCGEYHFRNNGRALTLGQREGFVKIVADESNRIIGAHILGAHASELIGMLTLAITVEATADTVARMIHPHPSLSEAIWEACALITGMPIHVYM